MTSPAASFLDRASRRLRDMRTEWRRARIERAAARCGRRFYCRALSGDSDYNISINCDMTVSCNCQDDGGLGILGDFSGAGFPDIFAGPIASAFRQSLAEGRLPIPTCANCSELREAGREEALRQAGAFHLPTRGLMVENTCACNVHCRACARDRILASRKSHRLSLDDIHKIAGLLHDRKIEILNYFKYGEPFLSPTIAEELSVIRQMNPGVHIVISTNGIFLDTLEKRQAALLADLIYFSLDGATDATVRRYQRGGSFAKSYENMKALVRHRNDRKSIRPAVEWKYVLFNWNDRKAQVLKAVELAREAGVNGISFWPATIPLMGRSWRYRYSSFFKTLGDPSWKGREVRFDGTG